MEHPTEHVTKVTLTKGGVYAIHCSCGGYDATAPTSVAAETAAARHRRGVVAAEYCPGCGEVYYPARPGTGELCRTCQYRAGKR